MIDSPKILACTDGSVYADSVYDHAAWAAGQLNTGLHVLHMLPPLDSAAMLKNFSGSIGLDARGILKEELVNLEEAYGRVAIAKSKVILEAAKAHLRRAGVADFTVEARHGVLSEYIEQDTSHPELIVIGKRGEAADFERLHLGANVERIIRSCPHPVLVASRTCQPVQRALIAYDGGRSAVKAIDYLIGKPLMKGVALHLLAVGKPHKGIESDLASAQQRLAAAGFQVQHSHLEGYPEEVFARFIGDHQINLLVMGAYGHSRIRQFIVGSTTTTMVRTSRVPVLMFR